MVIHRDTAPVNTWKSIGQSCYLKPAAAAAAVNVHILRKFKKTEIPFVDLHLALHKVKNKFRLTPEELDIVVSQETMVSMATYSLQ